MAILDKMSWGILCMHKVHIHESKTCFLADLKVITGRVVYINWLSSLPELV